MAAIAKGNKDPSSAIDDGPIYYFGYGPMVHPTVRQRRGIEISQEWPAVLKDFRLSFAFGGTASVIPQIGYDIHGILMQTATKTDWEKLQDFETGYVATEVNVYPYKRLTSNPQDDDGEESLSDEKEDTMTSILETTPIRAYVFCLLEYDESKLAIPLQKLPQERYLRLIAEGMRQYGANRHCIEDQIMAVPFVASRKPDEYLKFEILPKLREQLQEGAALPSLCVSRYRRLCCDFATAHLFMVVGHHVLLVGPHDPTNPGALWLQQHGMHQLDITFTVHQTIVDPAVPNCKDETDIRPVHQAWAENFLVEFVERCGFVAHRIGVLEDDDNKEKDVHRPELDKLLMVLKETPTLKRSEAPRQDSCEHDHQEHSPITDRRGRGWRRLLTCCCFQKRRD